METVWQYWTDWKPRCTWTTASLHDMSLSLQPCCAIFQTEWWRFRCLSMTSSLSWVG